MRRKLPFLLLQLLVAVGAAGGFSLAILNDEGWMVAPAAVFVGFVVGVVFSAIWNDR